jgi:hypothetical protein
MSAVVDIRPYQARRHARVSLSDRVTQAVMTEFHGYPVAAIEAGISEANRIVGDRGDFTEALTQARFAVLRTADDPNAQRLLAFYLRREQRTQSHLRAIEGVLRKTHAPDEIAPALARARRVLERGGNFCRALLLAYRGEGH